MQLAAILTALTVSTTAPVHDREVLLVVGVLGTKSCAAWRSAAPAANVQYENWIMGFWTDALGSRAKDPLAYTPLFGTLGGMMVFATLCTPLIARLGKPDQPPLDPLTEVTPATLEVVG